MEGIGLTSVHEDRSMTIVQRTLEGCVLLLTAVMCALFFYCVVQRLMYPYELDWIEGEIMCHVVRLLQGLTMYPPPSYEFVAEMYPPVYYIMTAAAAKLLGTGMLAGRTVSVCACLLLIALIYRVCVRETGERVVALICSGFFISLYHVHGPWYDLARVDMLFFAFIFSGVVALSYRRNTARSIIAAAVLFVLGCFTKQNGIVYLGAASLYLIVADRRKGYLFIGLCAVLLIVPFVVMNASTDGWFGRYTLFNLIGYKDNLGDALPTLYHGIIRDIQEKLPAEIRYELCFKLPVFSTFMAAFVVYRIVSIRNLTTITLWDFMAAAGVCVYALVRPHPGSEKNDLINITLWGCVLLARGMHALSALSTRRLMGSARTTALALIALQLVLLVYDPREDLPYPGSQAKGDAFIKMVKEIPGEVYIPYHSFYGVLAGKQMVFNAGAFWGFQLLSPGTYTPADIIEKINAHYFAAIIIDETSYYMWLGQRMPFDNIALLLTSGEPLAQAIDRNYEISEKISYSHKDEFRNPTGFMTRPEIILVPRR